MCLSKCLNNGRLICDSHVEKFILEKLESMRPHLGFIKVAPIVLDKLDAKVRNIIVNTVKAHPTKGKTFTEIL